VGQSVEKLLELAKKRFPDQQIAQDKLFRKALVIPAGLVLDFFTWLKTEPELDFDYFDYSTVTDRPPEFMDMIYSVYSFQHNHRLAVKVQLPRANPSLPTVSHLWSNADWNEREILDLFGVHFADHPDPRRLMMPEDWEGHPLRKDYMHPNLVPRPD
jgi:NADH-quinone oxidoreductase subunit C